MWRDSRLLQLIVGEADFAEEGGPAGVGVEGLEETVYPDPADAGVALPVRSLKPSKRLVGFAPEAMERRDVIGGALPMKSNKITERGVGLGLFLLRPAHDREGPEAAPTFLLALGRGQRLIEQTRAGEGLAHHSIQ